MTYGKQNSIHPVCSDPMLPLSRTPCYIPSLFDPYERSYLLFRILGADVLRLGEHTAVNAIEEREKGSEVDTAGIEGHVQM